MAKLTVKKLESLTLADIGKRLPDEHSIYGLIKAKGNGVGVMFRWRYRFDGKLRDYTCGTWPTKSLKEIREAQEMARQLLTQGKDANEDKRIARLDGRAAQAEAVAQANTRIADAEALQARIDAREWFIPAENLRRTGATLMTALGVLPEVAERCLNHTEESRVKRTYQQHSYDAEKREAWRLLGERLELLTRGDENVVTLRPRSKAAAVVSA